MSNDETGLTWEQAAEIKQKLLDGAGHRQLAREYDVGRMVIWSIVKGRVWDHVEPKLRTQETIGRSFNL